MNPRNKLKAHMGLVLFWHRNFVIYPVMPAFVLILSLSLFTLIRQSKR